MNFFTVLLVTALAIIAVCSEDDGKYRPTLNEATTSTPLRTFPTTNPITTYPAWNPNRHPWNDARRYDNRWNPRYDPKTTNPYYDYLSGRPYRDYRTIRLDEKFDSKGYRYVYETVGGILAEEVGTFENFGLKNEGVRSQGYVQIKDPVEGTIFRIDYQVDSKDAYVERNDGREPQKTPPSIIKLLNHLEQRK